MDQPARILPVVGIVGAGQLARMTIQAAIRPRREPIVAAVTGGTGEYANARGVLEVAGGVDTITLAP